jgi:hypothetical protein
VSESGSILKFDRIPENGHTHTVRYVRGRAPLVLTLIAVRRYTRKSDGARVDALLWQSGGGRYFTSGLATQVWPVRREQAELLIGCLNLDVADLKLIG